MHVPAVKMLRISVLVAGLVASFFSSALAARDPSECEVRPSTLLTSPSAGTGRLAGHSSIVAAHDSPQTNSPQKLNESDWNTSVKHHRLLLRTGHR